MRRVITGYCWRCCEDTKQLVIDCDESFAYRAFFAIFTLGCSEMLPKDYNCECLRCGRINSVRKGMGF